MGKRTAVQAATARAVLARDGHVCVLALDGCTGVATCADHRAGRGMGGSTLLNGAANLVAACWPCNTRKEWLTGADAQHLTDRGLRLRRNGRTAEDVMTAAEITPVRYPDGQWWLLDGSGGRTYLGGVR